LADSLRSWIEEFPEWDGEAAATYVRVSGSNQKLRGFSIEAQSRDNRKTIERIKPPRVIHYVDAGRTGRKFDNRQINEILSKQEAGEIKYLVTTAIDRLGRDLAELQLFFLQFCKAGGTLEAPLDQRFSFLEAERLSRMIWLFGTMNCRVGCFEAAPLDHDGISRSTGYCHGGRPT